MPKALPQTFDSGHNLCFALHDLLAQHVVKGEEAGLLSFEIQLDHIEHANAINDLQGEELWRWFEANGYRHVLDQLSYRHLIFGLLADLCQFVYEGLKCSEKGKLSVAFSLLRKPLQDNLFYLEWLLADRTGFLALFQRGADHIDPTRLGKDMKKATRIDIITKAMDQTEHGRWLNPEWVYDLRYEKASNFGLDRAFNQAIHLVTTVKHYVTPTESLNFIFCSDDDREQLWHQLYLTLPAALMHAFYVVRRLFSSFAPEFQPFDAITDLWLTAGFLLWVDDVGAREGTNIATATFDDLTSDEHLACPHCDSKLEFDAENLRRFWDEGNLLCRECGSDLPILAASQSGEEC